MKFFRYKPSTPLIPILVLLAAVGASVVVLAALYGEPAIPASEQALDPQWVVTPAPEDGGRMHIQSEKFRFDADVPAGWFAEVTPDGRIPIKKEDFPECRLGFFVQPNDASLSAVGYVDQLDPPGTLPVGVTDRIATVQEINGWPVARGVTEYASGALQRDALVPQGERLYVARMQIAEFPQQNITTPHPRIQECETAFDDLVASFTIK